MHASKRSSNKLQAIKWSIISQRNYMVIKSKTAKRFQNITAVKIKRQKKERLKSRYRENFESEPVVTSFNARLPSQIQCRYLLTQQVRSTNINFLEISETFTFVSPTP